MAVCDQPGKVRPKVEFSGFAGYGESAGNAQVAGENVPILANVRILAAQEACRPGGV